MRHASCIAAICMGLAAPAQAALSEEAGINAGLQIVATADMIRKGCGSIEPRMIRAYAYLRALGKEARKLGYSKGEIETYVEDDAAKDVIEARARDWLVARGGVDEAALCTTGLAEIDAGTNIGRLLKRR